MSKYFYPGDIKSATTLLGHRKFLAPAHHRHYTLGNTRMRCVTERDAKLCSCDSCAGANTPFCARATLLPTTAIDP